MRSWEAATTHVSPVTLLSTHCCARNPPLNTITLLYYINTTGDGFLCYPE